MYIISDISPTTLIGDTSPIVIYAPENHKLSKAGIAKRNLL